MGIKRHKKHKHFLDHEEHEERLKNKFIVRRKMAAKRHRRISGEQENRRTGGIAYSVQRIGMLDSEE